LVMVALIAISPISILTPALATAPYSTTTVLLTGLTNPTVLAVDQKGLVYFNQLVPSVTLPDSSGTQYQLYTAIYETYSPKTGGVTTLFQVPDTFLVSGSLVVDSKGEVFYFISTATVSHDSSGNPYVSQWNYELCRFNGQQTILFIISSTSYNGAVGLTGSLALDFQGNLYFMTNGDTTVYKLPAGLTAPQPLLTLTDGTLDNAISIASLATTAQALTQLYFVESVPSLQAVRLCRYDVIKGTLTTVLQRSSILQGTGFNAGGIPYLSTNSRGDTYYLYRQRTYITATPAWGYFELGIASGAVPKILYSESTSFTPLIFSPGQNEMQASLTGNVFFSLCDEHQLTAPTDYYVYWFNPSVGGFSTILHSTLNVYTLQLDGQGNLYYTDSTSTLARINA